MWGLVKSVAPILFLAGLWVAFVYLVNFIMHRWNNHK